MARKLADGVYQAVVTAELQHAIETDGARRAIEVAAMPEAEAHVALARFVRAEIERALGDLRGEDRVARQVELVNDLLSLLIDRELTPAPQRVAPPARELLGVFPLAAVAPRRPEIPLASSALLTLGRGEPRIGSELAREFESADRVDALVSFITKGGVRQLRDAIEDLCRRHRPGDPPVLRIITTTYTGATEAAAVVELASLPGVAVKVSYDGRRTRLHAKAWLFHRATGLSTAYVGSANLSAPALTAGLEWMMKVAAAELPEVVKKFEGAFETLWADREFERFDPTDDGQRDRLFGALEAAEKRDEVAVRRYYNLQPYEYQREILEQLEAERTVHGRTRNLVVAATGTGKTMIAAFDYARRAEAAGLPPRLLFLAHTRQILVQAREAFRDVLRQSAFGDLLTGEDHPERLTHLFATIQTVRSGDLIARLGGDYWDHVVVDECHHVPAPSYQDVVPALRPAVLVGLTATPERTDGRSLLGDFGGKVAAELRLWQALERQLLCPFEYYGIDDGVTATQLEAVRWNRRTGYDLEDLDRLYTGNHARADRVVAELRRKVADVRTMRALGFCVSVRHAAFMASHVARLGINAVALSGDSTSSERAAAQNALAGGRLQAIFTCDLFNEGVDLPRVDTLLLLRPTQSPTLFLQQLGRGLRLADGKTACLVLDFIGQHRAEFRFDGVLTALTGLPRARLAEAAAADFPFLPSGCSMSLDALARETVLRSLRASVEARWATLVAEATGLAGPRGTLSLAEFLTESGRELDDLYRLQRGSWTRLLRDAGLTGAAVTDIDLDLCHRLKYLLHLDDRDRLQRIERWLAGDDPATEVERRDALMLGYQVSPSTQERFAPDAVLPWLRSSSAASAELTALARWLADRVSLPASQRPVADWPLVLHRHYSRREILTACGYWSADRKVPHQQGIHRIEAERRELLFVTLDKSSGGFSPTTSYRDYAISAERFHWETQNAVAADSATARRYANHAALGWSIYLFVQTHKGEPFAFCGPVHHEAQGGSRPVAIVWRLEHALPAALVRTYQTLASG